MPKGVYTRTLQQKEKTSDFMHKLHWKGGCYVYWHRKAQKSFLKSVCERCGLKLEDWMTHKDPKSNPTGRMPRRVFDLHCLSEDYTKLTENNWITVCRSCHIKLELESGNTLGREKIPEKLRLHGKLRREAKALLPPKYTQQDIDEANTKLKDICQEYIDIKLPRFKNISLEKAMDIYQKSALLHMTTKRTLFKALRIALGHLIGRINKDKKTPEEIETTLVNFNDQTNKLNGIYKEYITIEFPKGKNCSFQQAVNLLKRLMEIKTQKDNWKYKKMRASLALIISAKAYRGR